MDRDQLQACLDAGLSLPQIGKITNRDPSTVGYWVRKHGLTANGSQKYAPRGELTSEQLKPLVERDATLKEIADEVGRSTSTVRYWLRKHGLATRRRHVNTDKATAAFEAGLKRFVGTCRRHGETGFLLFKTGRHRCAQCNSEAVARRRRKVKRALVEEAGGRCAVCGYDRHPAALQFHHLDPAMKRFTVSRRGTTYAFARSWEEAQKCVLLCATCHAEVEVGAVVVPLELTGS